MGVQTIPSTAVVVYPGNVAPLLLLSSQNVAGMVPQAGQWQCFQHTGSNWTGLEVARLVQKS